MINRGLEFMIPIMVLFDIAYWLVAHFEDTNRGVHSRSLIDI